jgi:hypothetical protein
VSVRRRRALSLRLPKHVFTINALRPRFRLRQLGTIQGFCYGHSTLASVSVKRRRVLFAALADARF